MDKPLRQWESDVTSQTGEDGVIRRIFDLIGDGAKTAVEFGAADGRWLSNTWALEHHHGWSRWLFDGDARGNPHVTQALLTRENINEVFRAAGVPKNLDVMSIDVDGNDFWLWKACEHHARLVVIEYNPALRPPHALVMPYNPTHTWDYTTYYGASLKALDVLGASMGYRLVHCTALNGFFLREEDAEVGDLARIAPMWEHRTDHQQHDFSRTWAMVE